MADIAQLRREARRKKILENSHNRLKFISGNTVTGDTSGAERLISSITTDYSGLEEHNHDSFLSEEISSVPQEYIKFNEGPSNDKTLLEKTLVQKFILSKYDIVVLSILIQILYTLLSTTFVNGYFFLPIIIYSLTKSFWFDVETNSSIFNLVLVLSNVSVNKIQKILKITHYAGNIFHDICIFLFVVVCTHVLFFFLRDNFIT